MAVNRTLAGKTIFISGGSRGIGLAIALRAAHDGANIATAAETSEPQRSMPGTIGTAARQIEEAGGGARSAASSWPTLVEWLNG
jgi:citronellol/citronellal dehydrogenase